MLYRSLRMGCSIVDQLLLLSCPDPMWEPDFPELGYFVILDPKAYQDSIVNNHINVALGHC